MNFAATPGTREYLSVPSPGAPATCALTSPPPPAALPLFASLRTHPWVRRLLLGAGAAASLVLAAGVVALRPDLRVVEHVEFVGAERASTASLRHLADVPNGTHILGVDPDAVAASVAKHPWVGRAEARRVWPDTVRIQIVERVPAALLHRDGLWYLDAAGRPFARAEADLLDLPSITGLSPELTGAHPQLAQLVVRDALWLLEALDERGLVHRSEVSEISFTASRGFSVYAGVARFAFATADLNGQVDRLALLAQRGVSLTEPQLIDLAPDKVAIVRPLAPTGEG